MIQLSPETRFGIILPNTNKAFSEAVKNATPEQLETLKEGKDLKSLLSSLFQEKTAASKSDQTLLDLLKNAPVFKNMGNFNDTLQSLNAELRSSPQNSAKAGFLENFLKTITSMDPQTLKSQIASSGIFMESKIASALQKLPDLIQTLEDIRSSLAKSPSSEAKNLAGKITAILEDPIFSKPTLSSDQAARLAEGMKKLENLLQAIASKNDPLYSQRISDLTETLISQENTAEIKKNLSEVYSILLSSKASAADSLLDSIEALLKNISLTQVKTLAEQLQNLQDANPAKELSSLSAKLASFSDPKELSAELFLKEAMADDLKSQLLTLHDDLAASADPSAQKLLEQTDKLLLQIDYHQLLSHLSASNSLYFPFVWEQLEKGSVSFKKNKNKKFYCEINLKLKTFGMLDLMMGLYDENQLEIQAYTEKEELKNLIREHLGELRSLLIDAGLTPRSIRISQIYDAKTRLDGTYESHEGSDMGFEVKV